MTKDNKQSLVPLGDQTTKWSEEMGDAQLAE